MDKIVARLVTVLMELLVAPLMEHVLVLKGTLEPDVKLVSRSFSFTCQIRLCFLSTAICTNPCQNGGTCIAPETCQCSEFLGGPTCEVRKSYLYLCTNCSWIKVY